MGAYAVPSNKPFVTKKKINMKRKRNPELEARRAYIETHDFYFVEDSETGDMIMKAKKKVEVD